MTDLCVGGVICERERVNLNNYKRIPALENLFGEGQQGQQNNKFCQNNIYKRKCVLSDSQLVNLLITPWCLFVTQTQRRFCHICPGWACFYMDWLGWCCSLWLENLSCYSSGECQTHRLLLKPWQLTWDTLEGNTTPYIQKRHTTMHWESEDKQEPVLVF